jgi:hypothetical protein
LNPPDGYVQTVQQQKHSKEALELLEGKEGKGGEVKCAEATFTGTMTAASESLRAKAVYKGRTVLGSSATVSMEGCEYEFHVAEETSPQHFKGNDAIVNTTGKSCEEKPVKIKITTLTCVVTSGPQTGLKTVEFVDLNPTSWKTPTQPSSEIKLSIAITGAKYTEGSGCFKPGEHSNGAYAGATLLKIYNGPGAQIGGRVH